MKKKILELRFKIIQYIREYFLSKGFLEVDTPILANTPGIEPHLEAFTTKLKFPNSSQSKKYYLPFSPEFYMKKLLAMGFNNIFQIAHCFRNEELSDLHQPEFLMLEWYRTNADYIKILEDTEELFDWLANKLQLKTITTPYGEISIEKPWEKITVRFLFRKFLRIELEKCTFPYKLYSILKNMGIKIDEKYCVDFNTLFFSAFLNVIEPNLNFKKPVFIMDYPTIVSALAKPKENNIFYSERFELYIGKVELVNACTELTDYLTYMDKYSLSTEERKNMKKSPYPLDMDFTKIMKKNFKPSAGAALGIDRLVMLLLGKTKIDEIMPFPIKRS